jgi:hypothetical protein
MNNNTSWTQQEETIVLKNVENNSTNLRRSFEISSKQLGRTPSSISQHYYKKLRAKTAALNLYSVTGKVYGDNVKNSIRNAASIHETLNGVEVIINKLSVEDLKAIVYDYLTGKIK